MAKKVLPPGILFPVLSSPPTNIMQSNIKNETLRADLIGPNKVLVTISFEIHNATLHNQDIEVDDTSLNLKGYLPFIKNAAGMPLDNKIKIKNFIQAQEQLEGEEKHGNDDVARFTIIMDVNDGKIGGASAKFLSKLKRESIAKVK